MLKPHFHASPDLFIQILTKPVKKKKTPSRNVSRNHSRNMSGEISRHVFFDIKQNEVFTYETDTGLNDTLK